MKSIATKIIRKIRSASAFGRHHRSYLHHTIKKPELKKEERYAIVNMDSQFREDDYSRHLYILCMHMERAGFKPVVKMEWRDIIGIDGYGFRKYLWRENYVFVRRCTTPVNTVVLKQPGTADHIIHIPYGYNIPASTKVDCIAPFPIDPTQHVNYVQIASQLPTIKRTVRVLFSGKTIKKLYGTERLKIFFNHISRTEVIDYIAAHFGDRTKLLTTKKDAEMLRQVLDSKDYLNEIIINEVKTDPKDWFKVLSKADFFLCLPGARMPWCHNAVEAMSVGTIPIIEYGNLFDPALEHMKNCIRYSSYDELDKAINQVLAMDRAEIEILRKNVFEYFNKYLSTESITNSINSFCNSTREKLTVAVPFVPTRKEAKAIPARQR
jgi:hypothetical protein